VPLPCGSVPATYNLTYADVDSTAHDNPDVSVGIPVTVAVVMLLKPVNVPSVYV
jgi:hypothetical protein